MKLNPIPFLLLGGKEAVLNTADQQTFANGRVYKNSQDLDLKLEDIKSAAFYWVSDSEQPERRQPLTLKVIKVTSEGQSISFCSNNQKIKENSSVSLKKC